MASESHTPETGEISTLLRAWTGGSETALNKLIPVIYAELRRLARHYMRGEKAGHTLQTTALVNEAYLRLVDYRYMEWRDRAHFFAVSAQLMRRILVDHARRRNLKRGGAVLHISLEETATMGALPDPGLIALDDALTTFAKLDPRKVRVVELRFFGGLNVEETAEVLQVSPVTVLRDWSAAKAWLRREMIGSRSNHDS